MSAVFHSLPVCCLENEMGKTKRNDFKWFFYSTTKIWICPWIFFHSWWVSVWITAVIIGLSNIFDTSCFPGEEMFPSGSGYLLSACRVKYDIQCQGNILCWLTHLMRKSTFCLRLVIHKAWCSTPACSLLRYVAMAAMYGMLFTQ